MTERFERERQAEYEALRRAEAAEFNPHRVHCTARGCSAACPCDLCRSIIEQAKKRREQR